MDTGEQFSEDDRRDNVLVDNDFRKAIEVGTSASEEWENFVSKGAPSTTAPASMVLTTIAEQVDATAKPAMETQSDGREAQGQSSDQAIDRMMFILKRSRLNCVTGSDLVPGALVMAKYDNIYYPGVISR